jgi:hypothetical protein
VNDWRQEGILFGKKKKARRFSENRAFEMVQKEVKELYGLNLPISTIKFDYNHVKKVKKARLKPPYVSPFAE